MDAKLIGARLQSLRGQRTQAEVARGIGVSCMAISSYESGQRIPRDEIKIKLAQYFQKTVEEIFFTTE